MEKGQQILKSRDDKSPVSFHVDKTSEEVRFKLSDTDRCAWSEPGTSFGSETLRPRIEPWLTSLFQSEHLALLVGSGLTRAVHLMATGTDLPGMSRGTFSEFANEIDEASKASATAAGRDEGNIEDQIRVANELIRGLEIAALGSTKLPAKVKVLKENLKSMLAAFGKSILQGETGLVTANEELRTRAFNYLVSFLMSFASRTGTRDRLQVFTTNYDRYLEAGAELAGLHLLDRFVGSLAPIFRSSRLDIDVHYNPPGIRGEPRYLEGVARFTKLHGSVDWIDTGDYIRRFTVPFGAESLDPYLKAPGLTGIEAGQMMIYPNSAKDRERLK